MEQARDYFRQKPVVGQLHESIRMYALCKGMSWAHLPVEGGIYDQHPKFMDDMLFLMNEDAKAEKRRHDESQRKMKRSGR